MRFAVESEAATSASPGVDAALAVRPLLQALLGELRRSRATVLRFQIDSPSIAAAVWDKFQPLMSDDERRVVSNGGRLRQALDDLLRQACRGDCAEPLVGTNGSHRANPREPPGEPHPLAALARWFDELCASLDTASDASLAAIALRLEGYDARDVAARLGLGVRLVRRLLADARLLLDNPLTK